MPVDLGRAPYRPFAHQAEGVERLVALVEPELGRVVPGRFALFDQMGAGKTKQVADAAQVLHERGEINTVIVVCPAYVRGVWFDPNVGEIRKHLWTDASVLVIEYHEADRRWTAGDGPTRLRWIVTNFEYVRATAERGQKNRRRKKRSSTRLEALKQICDSRTLLVIDESSAVKNQASSNCESMAQLSRLCGRCWILNGTPVTNGLGDLYGQMKVLDNRIIGLGWWQFRSRYAEIGGWQGKMILGWRGVEEVQAAVAPYVLRRRTEDCLDLPPKLPVVTVPVPLSASTWKMYKDMRRDAVAWMRENVHATAAQAGVKAMRLAQITSGFLGGLTQVDVCDKCDGVGADEGGPCAGCGGAGGKEQDLPEQHLSDEKLRVFLDWHSQKLEDDPDFKLVVWCRFRADVRAVSSAVVGAARVGVLWAGQTRDERSEAVSLLHPDTAAKGPVVLVGIPSSGGVGINLAAAGAVLWYSHTTSLLHRLQADDRPYRTGQKGRVWYGDLVATGPDGQKTIDHHVVEALRKKDETARWTCSAWIKKLEEE